MVPINWKRDEGALRGELHQHDAWIFPYSDDCLAGYRLCVDRRFGTHNEPCVDAFFDTPEEAAEFAASLTPEDLEKAFAGLHGPQPAVA